jgi:ataxia telangiectasia mutated family protein
MRRELRILTEALREGKKVTERKKAVDEITRWFSSTSNVKKVGSNNDEWVEIFDALAIGAKDEHDLAARKTSKATDGKLEGISAAFRTVVEASVPYLNNASLEYLIPRLVAILKFSGALDGATGSNYARALLSITSHPPHVRSLSDKFWYYIARSSWAILLGDKMSGRLGWEEEDPKLQPRPSKPNSSGAGMCN